MALEKSFLLYASLPSRLCSSALAETKPQTDTDCTIEDISHLMSRKLQLGSMHVI